jgi:hypothetical protein
VAEPWIRPSVGDVIITRINDRRLRTHCNRFGQNGDRWTVTRVGGAQDVSGDTMHGLVTGQESRQQLYTMLSRGRAANHLYLQVVEGGDAHSLIRPDTVASRTPTELLKQIIARDDTPTSATTLLRQLRHPAARLFDAVQRYTDRLQVAAEQLVGPQIVHTLDGQAHHIVPELTREPSWPTLRAHLLALAAETGEHPLSTCRPPPDENSTPQKTWPPYSTRGSRSRHPLSLGRYLGFPAYRQGLHDHHVYGEYLAKRSQFLIGLANQVRDSAGHSPE